MKKLVNWFKKKKMGINECAEFGIDQIQSDQFFGGFKEYMPPIYEHESAVKSFIKVTDLYTATDENN
jgi:hypothetical protein